MALSMLNLECCERGGKLQPTKSPLPLHGRFWACFAIDSDEKKGIGGNGEMLSSPLIDLYRGLEFRKKDIVKIR